MQGKEAAKVVHLRDNDTQQQQITQGVVSLIKKLFDKDIFEIFTAEFLATLEDKTIGIKLLNRIIKDGHDVLLEGVEQARRYPGDTTIVYVTDQILEQNCKSFLARTVVQIGYALKDAEKTQLYISATRLREVCQAKSEALTASEFQLHRYGTLPTRAEVLEFLKPKFIKISTALEYVCTLKNPLEKMQYIESILYGVFDPELQDEKIHDLIIDIMGEYVDPSRKEQELEKAIKIFYVDVDAEAAGNAVREKFAVELAEAKEAAAGKSAAEWAKTEKALTEKAAKEISTAKNEAAEKFASLKMLYLKLGEVTTLLGQRGLDTKELREADEDYAKLKNKMRMPNDVAKRRAKADGKKGAELVVAMNRLTLSPYDPFPQQEPQLSAELALAFEVDVTGFAKVGTKQETSDIRDRFKHFQIARLAYDASKTALFHNSILVEYKNSGIPQIAGLAESVIFRQAFLDKVLADTSQTFQFKK